MVPKFCHQLCSTVECGRGFHLFEVRRRDLRFAGGSYEIEEQRVEGTAYSEYRQRPARKIEPYVTASEPRVLAAGV